MPKTINKTRTAQRTRKSIYAGKNRKKQGRKRSGGNKAQGPRVIANSIFALTLQPKYGYEVMQKVEGNDFSNDEDYGRMYKDLLLATRHALKLVKNETSTFDPLAGGFDWSTSFVMVINMFKNNIVPKGYEFNIDGNAEEGYYFTCFKAVAFPFAWHTFEIKTPVKYLRRNKKLHDLFIQLMSCLYKKTGINTWWDSAYGYADVMLDDIDEAMNYYGLDEEEDEYELRKKELTELKESYTKGEVYKYKLLLRNSDFIKPENLLKQLSKFRKTNPVIIWMYKACEFLKLQGNINDYVYEEYVQDEEGLRMEDQAAIIWSYDDIMYRYQSEAMDNDAGNMGVIEPYLNFPISKDNRFIDMEDLPEREQWLTKLSRLQDDYTLMLKKIMK